MSDKDQDGHMVMNEGNADGVLLVLRKLAKGKAQHFLEMELSRKGIEAQKPVKEFGPETEIGVKLACQFLDKLELKHIPLDDLLKCFWKEFGVECQDVNRRHKMNDDAERKTKTGQQQGKDVGGGNDGQNQFRAATTTAKTSAKQDGKNAVGR